MWQFLLGLSAGVYIGTHYDCKPVIKNATDYVQKIIPKKKD